MKNKVKSKVLNSYVYVGKEVDYKRVVLDFNEYINSKEVYKELITMKCTQYSVVDIIKEVWKEILSKD